jgi:hypothetical protein
MVACVTVPGHRQRLRHRWRRRMPSFQPFRRLTILASPVYFSNPAQASANRGVALPSPRPIRLAYAHVAPPELLSSRHLVWLQLHGSEPNSEYAMASARHSGTEPTVLFLLTGSWTLRQPRKAHVLSIKSFCTKYSDIASLAIPALQSSSTLSAYSAGSASSVRPALSIKSPCTWTAPSAQSYMSSMTAPRLRYATTLEP